MSHRRPGLRKRAPLSRALRIRWNDRSLRKERRYDPLRVKTILNKIRDTLRAGAKNSSNDYETMTKFLTEIPPSPEKNEYEKMAQQMKDSSILQTFHRGRRP